MVRSGFVLLFAALVVGCSAGPSAKEKYDEAVHDLERSQSRLDNLRPAYDAARQKAANAVCKEIAGATVEESATDALAGLSGVLNQTTAPPSDAAATTDAAKKPSGKKTDELDKTIDNLIAAEKNAQQKQAEVTAPLLKAKEVMAKINTPGTPEAKQMEEKLAKMPEAQAYERQKNRVEKAQKDVDEAEAEMNK